MKNLPPDLIHSIQRSALWSREEESILADVDMVTDCRFSPLEFLTSLIYTIINDDNDTDNDDI